MSRKLKKGIGSSATKATTSHGVIYQSLGLSDYGLKQWTLHEINHLAVYKQQMWAGTDISWSGGIVLNLMPQNQIQTESEWTALEFTKLPKLPVILWYKFTMCYNSSTTQSTTQNFGMTWKANLPSFTVELCQKFVVIDLVILASIFRDTWLWPYPQIELFLPSYNWAEHQMWIWYLNYFQVR